MAKIEPKPSVYFALCTWNKKQMFIGEQSRHKNVQLFLKYHMGTDLSLRTFETR